MTRRVLLLLSLPFLLFVLLSIFDLAIVVLGFTLISGWYFAGARLLSAVHVDSADLLLIALALTILVLGTHRFCIWIAARRMDSGDSANAWKWKWTLAGYAAISFALLSGFCFIAMVHQSGWMFSSGESWFKPRRGARALETANTRYLGSKIEAAANSNNWSADAIQRAYWNGFQNPSEKLRNVYETHELLLAQTNGQTTAFVIVPRRPRNWILIADRESGTRMESMFYLTNARSSLATILQATGIADK